jgi:hypothetical protein
MADFEMPTRETLWAAHELFRHHVGAEYITSRERLNPVLDHFVAFTDLWLSDAGWRSQTGAAHDALHHSDPERHCAEQTFMLAGFLSQSFYAGWLAGRSEVITQEMQRQELVEKRRETMLPGEERAFDRQTAYDHGYDAGFSAAKECARQIVIQGANQGGVRHVPIIETIVRTLQIMTNKGV